MRGQSTGCTLCTERSRAQVADLRGVEVLRRRLGRVHIEQVDLDAAQRRMIRYAVLPAHVASVQDRMMLTPSG